MPGPLPPGSASAVRQALARRAYACNAVRIIEPDLAGCQWLAASPRGLFGIGVERAHQIAYGWFFGLCQHDGRLYLFENCGHRDRDSCQGRIIRFDLDGGMIAHPRVLVTGLHGNIHQLAVIGGALCAVDTANQAIRRYTLEGELIDVRQPFPVASSSDTSGAYLHINSIAEVGGRIGLVLHNGKAIPDKNSELAWLCPDWKVSERNFLAGRYCHDIVADEQGRIWHCASQSGEIMRSDGLRVQITTDLMTRGLAFNEREMAVGMCTFGPRHIRGTLNGGIAILDRDHRRLREIDLPGPPTAIIAL